MHSPSIAHVHANGSPLGRAALALATLAGALAGGCGDSGTAETDTQTATESEGDASFESLELAYVPAEKNVLSGFLTVQTDVPTTLSAVVVEPLDGAPSWTVPPSGIASDEDGRAHEVMILGLKAERGYRFSVTARHEASDTEKSGDLSFTTEPLPSVFPPVRFLDSDPARVEPGVTFFDSTGREGFTSTGGFLIAVDALGDVIWYYTASTVQQPCDLHRLQNGNLIFLGIESNGADSMAIELDMMGREVRRWTRAETGVIAMHGDLFEMPDGNILTASVELREISGYPGDKTYNVVGEIVTEFSRDGVLQREHKLLDILDPYRMPSQDFHLGFYNAIFGPMSKDWAHVNAVSYDATDDTFLVSSRHQDIVFKLTRETGELVWVIGEEHSSSALDDAWPLLELVGEGRLPSHMHAPEVTPSGTIMMFDNSNATRDSRAVEFAVDLESMTLEQVWEYRDPDFDPPAFSTFIGDADLQPGGTVLINFGATLRDPATLDTQGAYAHILEVDYATGEKLFELDVRGEESDLLQRLVYRVDRQPSLYADGEPVPVQ